MKRLAKLLTTLTVLTATIYSSEVKVVHSHRFVDHLALCANFTIEDRDWGGYWEHSGRNTREVRKSYQCGQDWDGIKKGIRRQLKEEQNAIDQEQRDNNRSKTLERIKNDFVGYTIQ